MRGSWYLNIMPRGPLIVQGSGPVLTRRKAEDSRVTDLLPVNLTGTKCSYSSVVLVPLTFPGYIAVITVIMTLSIF